MGREGGAGICRTVCPSPGCVCVCETKASLVRLDCGVRPGGRETGLGSCARPGHALSPTQMLRIHSRATRRFAFWKNQFSLGVKNGWGEAHLKTD